jgi:hypothetical protein
MTAQVYGTSLLTILFYTPLVCTYVQLWPASPVRESQKLKAWKQKKLMQSKRLAFIISTRKNAYFKLTHQAYLSNPSKLPVKLLPVVQTCPSNLPIVQTYPSYRTTKSAR